MQNSPVRREIAGLPRLRAGSGVFANSIFDGVDSSEPRSANRRVGSKPACCSCS